MKKGRHIFSAALAGGLAVALSGCGSSGDSTSNTTQGDDAAKTATVDLAVAFPEATAGKAIISSEAQMVGFRYCRIPQGEHWCDTFGESASAVLVTRDNPTARITIAPGLYNFGAGTFASSTMDSVIDTATTAGQIVEGPNRVVMTFLRGDWTFKTAAGGDDPLTLGDGSVLSGFKLYPVLYDNYSYAAPATAGKAAFNPEIPVGGFSEYAMVLKTSNGDQDGAWMNVFSQFHSGDDNNTTLDGFYWNVSQGCDADDCEPAIGERVISQLGLWFNYGEDMEYGDPWTLLPDETLTDGSGNPLPVDEYDSKPTDGVTIVTDIAEYQFQGKSETLIDATATAAKAVAADVPRSRAEALKAALGAASKSVATTNVGTLNGTWYEPVIVASGNGTNRGSWSFNDWVYNPDTGYYEEVVDACLVNSGSVIYATCGYLGTEWDPNTETYVRDPGEFSWGFAPTDPTNLGEYCDRSTGSWDYETNEYVCGVPTAPFDPWNFSDLNGDGVVDFGSFQFTHYLKIEETLSNVRIHRVTAKGTELPVSEVLLQ